MNKNQKIRVLFLIHDLSMGGAEKVLVNLVNHMDRTKFRITVLSLFGGGVNECFLDQSIEYRYIFHRSFPGNSRILKLFTPGFLHKQFIKEKYDIEISYLEGPSARIISGCPNKDTRLISWIHVEQHTKEVVSAAFRNYEEACQCYRSFDRIVCVSEYVKSDFCSLIAKLPPVQVLYNTVDTDQILRLKDEPVESGIFTNNEIKICGVGKIVPVKGFMKLARIHKRLRDDGLPVHTYVLGLGKEQSQIEDYLKRNNLRDSFTFLGYQKNPYKYVSKCDLFVCTSSAEGYSTAATEALILGVPVVTTPVSGMKEMLGENNEYGIVTGTDEVSLYSSIRRLLKDENMLKAYRTMAKERGKAFETEKTVKAVEEYLIS